MSEIKNRITNDDGSFAARSGSKLVTFLDAIVVIAGMTFILYHALFVW